jgi:hypothetical protein
VTVSGIPTAYINGVSATSFTLENGATATIRSNGLNWFITKTKGNLVAGDVPLDGFSADRTIAIDWDGTLTDSLNFGNLLRISTNGGVSVGAGAVPVTNSFNVDVVNDISIVADDDITISASNTGGTLALASNNTAQLQAPSLSLIGITGGSEPTLEFNEDNDLGTDAIILQAPNSLSGNFTQTFTAATGEIPIVLKGSATLDFGDIAAGTCEELTITVTGAAVGDVTNHGVPDSSTPTNIFYTSWVSSADTVTIMACNNALVTTSGNIASGTFKVQVSK